MATVQVSETRCPQNATHSGLGPGALGTCTHELQRTQTPGMVMVSTARTVYTIHYTFKVQVLC